MDVFFTKMHGAGNDFILLDNRQKLIQLDSSRISTLCDRHKGIGADGLLVVESDEGKEPRMVYFNADGSRASFCGNGARCFARFLFEMENKDGEEGEVCFMTEAGKITGWISGDAVKITLPTPKNLTLHIPLEIEGKSYELHKIDTGVPHVVLFEDCESLPRSMLEEIGSRIRWHKAFQPEGTNVNFAWRVGERKIKVRTYERGVEGETLACGSGVTASALISHLVLDMDCPIEVSVRSGETLKVYFVKSGPTFREAFLEGPAKKVFVGTIEIT
ncbi:diaminopimelate epimerase [Candidatus Methylacidiphilum infernorum]|uniref:Diaminopimelate epimerase n=1 Tax=Candidatus Methylacidiphilum infernorum TaxID=511746 RepID=A0ABX7PWL3_9BACT|nr:diaminopimelate epimerase [Candidatus Methylacidiphilum infernorum]QSR87396.1 diaminopimelate epimerase [Candidatus Methylacidiphilum infernorum]